MSSTKRGFIIGVLFLSLAILGCAKRETPKPPETGTPEAETLGRMMFDTPTPISDVGTVDTPRLLEIPGGTTHLVYLMHDGVSQRVMYSRMENGEFTKPSQLSQEEGTKTGGAFIAPESESDFIAYWVNLTVTGGRLIYKKSDNGGKTFTFEKQWNKRNEVRWPCVLRVGNEVVAYFFVRTRKGWELAMNRNFSAEDEPTIDSTEASPFHLQGVTDGARKVWLAYFERQPNADGGRIAFLTSTDGGMKFSRKYLFEDKVIGSIYSFFQIVRSVPRGKGTLHVIFTEESPEETILYYARSEDDGANFTTPVAMITSEEPLTHAPVILANGSYVFIATADTEEEGPALRYVLSEDGGKTFSAPAIATRNVANPETIAGTLSSKGNVMLVWDDLAGTTEVGEQIYRLNGKLRGR